MTAPCRADSVNNAVDELMTGYLQQSLPYMLFYSHFTERNNIDLKQGQKKSLSTKSRGKLRLTSSAGEHQHAEQGPKPCMQTTGRLRVYRVLDMHVVCSGLVRSQAKLATCPV